ncbi:phosphotransferase family protein [Brevundimonas aurifodinae]|uniref:Phosphotransferase family protein n=1 Tax=Brevundimonas aurifodinae TaxID=1508312 RepID=A0ABV1NMN1_9CAUL
MRGYVGPLSVRQFKGGQSNPTFELTTPTKRYVLRRKPPGMLLFSAHAVDREFEVISALHAQGFPVAQPLALCSDDRVLGSMFYVMERVDGRIFWDLKLPGLSPDERRAVYLAQVDALAALHRMTPDTVGLLSYGRPGNYFGRQVARWSKQYRASETRTRPAMDRLIAFLPSSLPTEGRARIVHGDYRLDNIIFSPTTPDILAVIDWELSTLGDPLADFSYLLLAWVLPATQRNGLAGADLEALGIPSLDEVLDRYVGAADVTVPPSFDWLHAYNLFRLAAICQGIAGRIREGTSVSTQAAAMADQVESLSDLAWTYAKRAGA